MGWWAVERMTQSMGSVVRRAWPLCSVLVRVGTGRGPGRDTSFIRQRVITL
jgi:hypothetical protein